MEYRFVKEVHVPTLVKELEFAGLMKKLSEVTASGTMVVCTLVKPLSSVDLSKLHELIGQHRSMNVAEAAVLPKIQDARQFGVKLIDEFAAENVASGFTPMQVAYTASKFGSVISLLMTGSLKTALGVIESMPPDPVIPPERVKRYANKLRTYLELPLK